MIGSEPTHMIVLIARAIAAVTLVQVYTAQSGCFFQILKLCCRSRARCATIRNSMCQLIGLIRISPLPSLPQHVQVPTTSGQSLWPVPSPSSAIQGLTKDEIDTHIKVLDRGIILDQADIQVKLACTHGASSSNAVHQHALVC